METSAYVKRLLREVWNTASLSQVACLLSCSYGTAYRCLEEAGCLYKPAAAGKPTRRETEILARHKLLTDALAAHKISARRYFNCIGCTIEMLETEPDDDQMIEQFKIDLPEALGLPSRYYNQKNIRLDLALGRGTNGVPCCYSQIYHGILGRGKTNTSALYHAQINFQQLSHKGRLELYIEKGFEAALQWEPLKRSETVRIKPELTFKPEPPPPTVEEMKRERQALIKEYNSISTQSSDRNQRSRAQVAAEITALDSNIMSIEDPERFRLESLKLVLANKVADSRTALHAANSDPKRFVEFEIKHKELGRQLAQAEQNLKILFAERKTRVVCS